MEVGGDEGEEAAGQGIGHGGTPWSLAGWRDLLCSCVVSAAHSVLTTAPVRREVGRPPFSH